MFKKTSIVAVVIVLIIFAWQFAKSDSVQKLQNLHTPIAIDDIASIRIWGEGIPQSIDGRDASKVEVKNIVKWFNSATDSRLNKEFKGTTPASGIEIKLKSGKEVSIVRSGVDFEIQRESELGWISYWARQPQLRDFLDKLAK